MGIKERQPLTLLTAGVIVAACLSMAAMTPSGEIIDSRSYEQAQTQVVTKPVAVVTDVRGIAQWRPGPDQGWVVIREGMTFDGPAEFRTGPRTTVTLTVTSGETLNIDRLGFFNLQKVVSAEGKVKFNMRPRDLRDVREKELQHDEITAPGKILAVRGCYIPWK